MESIDTFGHGGKNIRDQFINAFLSLWGKRFFDELSAERFADVAVRCLDASLPPQLLFFSSAQVAAEEIEIFIDKGFRQGRGGLVDHHESHVRLPIVDRFVL